MTVIAWDGKTLAADKRATTDDGSIAVVTKIERHEGALLATAGNGPVGREMRAWFKAGAIPTMFPESNKDDKATLAVFSHAGVDIYTMGPYPVRDERKCVALGCGRDFALAAMALGHSAYEAVALTCELNAFCGNGVDTLSLEA